MSGNDRAVMLARAQAGYYFVTGVWPLVHIRSFEALTGPKMDRWLVKTVGGLVAATGAALAVASQRREIPPELVVVAVGNAATLTVIDVVYVARRRIAPVYLLDALPEVCLIAGWVVWWRQRNRG